MTYKLKIIQAETLRECNSDVSFVGEQPSFCDKTLKSIRNNNVSRLIFADLNINSIRNKFQLLKEQIKANVDTIMISRTKIDNTIHHSQSFIEGFSTPYR